MESRFFSLVLALQRRHQWSVDKHLRRSFCRTRAGHELFILDTAQKCLHQQRRCAYVTAGQGTDSSSSRHSESHGFSEFSECCHFLPIGSSQRVGIAVDIRTIVSEKKAREWSQHRKISAERYSQCCSTARTCSVSNCQIGSPESCGGDGADGAHGTA